jgi:hypothetical protein
VRTFVALALVLAACGRSDRPSTPAAHEPPTAPQFRDADPLLLRVPRSGGIPRVSAYPNTDSVVWEGTERLPSVDRVLGFDDEGGTVSFVDSRGRPGRLDFRLGTVAMEASRAKLSNITTVDGITIYAIDPAGTLRRMTPSGDWSFKPPRPARDVFPQPDGSVVLLAAKGDSTIAWRLHPPESRLLDTARLPGMERSMRTQLGDRIYLVAKGRLVGLGRRTMQAVTPIEFDAPVTAMAATPSGDRLFVATDSSTALSVVDRYRERVTSSIELGGEPLELRMDPLGRWLLVRATKDSVRVIGVADGRVVGKTATRWHNDLPFVAPDGRIALAEKNDVVFVDASLQERARVRGGASDFWYSFLWAGFRPRDASLDRSEPLPGADTTDSTLMMPPVAGDSLMQPPIATDTALRPPAVRGFIVSFAALLSEERARELAGQIRVGGQAARIITTARSGTSVYRVVLGPYPTREEAERIGRESGQPSWWVYEGVP